MLEFFWLFIWPSICSSGLVELTASSTFLERAYLLQSGQFSVKKCSGARAVDILSYLFHSKKGSQALHVCPHPQQVVVATRQTHDLWAFGFVCSVSSHVAAADLVFLSQSGDCHVHFVQQAALVIAPDHAFDPEKTSQAFAAAHWLNPVNGSAGVQDQVTGCKFDALLAVSVLHHQFATCVAFWLAKKQGA